MRTLFLPPGESRFLPSSIEMRALDRETIESRTCAEELMERAGRGVVKEICRLRTPSRVLVLCGPGNNGGDGLVIARLLGRRRVSCTVIVVSSPKHSKEFLYHAAKVEDVFCLGPKHSRYPNSWKEIGVESAKLLFNRVDVVVDALLGTGQTREPSGSIAELIGYTNHAKQIGGYKVVSVDVPTGVNCDTGQVYTSHISADQTVCIEHVKRGVIQYPGREFAGELCVSSIGVSGTQDVECLLLDDQTAPRLAKRNPNSHKGSFGHLLVVGGCVHYPGAPELTARAGLRSGAALVTKCTPQNALYPASLPELMRLPCLNSVDEFSREDVPTVVELIRRCSAVAIGPGLGKTTSVIDFVTTLLDELKSYSGPVIVDADALNVVASSRAHSVLRNTVITPHPGEAARLLGCSTGEVMADRYGAARALRDKTESIVVLKGASTVIATTDRIFVSDSANPYMATGGSGDVLTGIIGGLAAQRFCARSAALLGVLLHCRAGERAVKMSGGTIIASDIIASLSSTVGNYTT